MKHLCASNYLAIFTFFSFSISFAQTSSLKEFTVEEVKQEVKISWETTLEADINGFQVQRSGDGLEWEPIAFIPKNGNEVEGSAYYFIDDMPLEGGNLYRVKQLGLAEDIAFSDPVTFDYLGTRRDEMLVFSSPVNEGLATIYYNTVKEGMVTLDLVDADGNLIERKDEALNRGDNLVKFDLSKISNGSYFVVAKKNEKKIARQALEINSSAIQLLSSVEYDEEEY